MLETGTGVSVGLACTAAEANGAKAAQVTRRTLEIYILFGCVCIRLANQNAEWDQYATRTSSMH